MVAFWYAWTKFLCWLLLRFRLGLEVHGRSHVPRRGGCILASNHVSFLDPPVVGTACPRRVTFLARADLFEHWALGAFMRAVGVISLRRGEADVGAVRAAAARLRAGHVVAIFPEGGRQFSGALGVAKRGVGLLAEAAQVPIVPVLVQGTFRALPPGSRRLHRAKIRVAFAPSIPYTVPSLPEGQAAARQRHEQLARAVTDAWHRLEEQLHEHTHDRTQHVQ
jgi:1-acyl-sn-glycerol-3-phosphate acyltransferase